MWSTNVPPSFGVNLVRLGQVCVLALLVSIISNGLYLGMSILGALLVFVRLQRYYDPRLQLRVSELHAATDQYVMDGELGRLRVEIRRWHWLCFVGFAGDVYDAWGRLCAADEEPRLALNYFQRALRAGRTNRSLDIQVCMVKMYARLNERETSEKLAVQLLKQNPHDLFLRHRLEMIIGDERIAQIA